MQKKSIYGMFMILLVAVAITLSGCWNKTPKERAEHITEQVAEELELNESQSAQLKRSTTKLLEKGKELRDIRTAIAEELVKQLRQDQVDPASLNAVVDENKAKLESLMNLLIEEFSEFHQTLTPAQRVQAAEKIESFQERRSHRRSWFG